MGEHISLWRRQLGLLLSDIGRGLFIVTHSGLAMLGLGVAALVLALWWQPAWLHAAETQVFNWLRERQVLVSWLPENRAERARAMELSELPPAQAAVADWLARKYRVAPEPLAALVAEAHDLSKTTKLPAHLLLAVFLCGCIGAEVGARAFRHKTRKSSFRRLALALSVLNPLWLLVWLEFGG